MKTKKIPTETTLLIVLKNMQILLAKKKRGFGKGKFNGVGGKIQSGETNENAMIREAQEEIGITPIQYEKVAEITFDEIFDKGVHEEILMHVFLAEKYSGTPIETDEMKPFWFNLNEIPYDQMFKDDIFWLPLVLSGKKIRANFELDENFNVKSHTLEILNNKFISHNSFEQDKNVFEK